eukprot:2068055-Prymnesium_polylepis.3
MGYGRPWTALPQKRSGRGLPHLGCHTTWVGLGTPNMASPTLIWHLPSTSLAPWRCPSSSGTPATAPQGHRSARARRHRRVSLMDVQQGGSPGRQRVGERESERAREHRGGGGGGGGGAGRGAGLRRKGQAEAEEEQETGRGAGLGRIEKPGTPAISFRQRSRKPARCEPAATARPPPSRARRGESVIHTLMPSRAAPTVRRREKGAGVCRRRRARAKERERERETC